MNKHTKFYYLVVLISCLLTIIIPNPFVYADSSNVLDWIESDESDKISEQQTEEQNQVVQETKSLPAIIGSLFFYTLLIILMIYGLIKFLAIRQKKLLPNQVMKTVGGMQLGNNKSLQMIKIGKKIYLLGVSDTINLIKEFTDEEEIKEIERNLHNNEMNISKSIFNKVKDKTIKNVNTKSNGNFQQLFQQSIDRIRGKQNQINLRINESKENKKDVRDDT